MNKNFAYKVLKELERRNTYSYKLGVFFKKPIPSFLLENFKITLIGVITALITAYILLRLS